MFDRFGVGKAEQDSFFTSEENVTRKKLESEAQLEETEEETRIREVRCRQLLAVAGADGQLHGDLSR